MDEMNADVRIEEVNPVKKKFLFDIPWVDVKKEMDSVYRGVGKKARVKGFRPGKTPRKVLEAYYKEEAEGQTISNLVNRLYGEVLKKNNIVPVTEPVIDQDGIEKDKNFIFSATVEVEPIIEPKDYIGLELEKEKIKIADKDVQAKLEELRHVYSTLEDVKGNRDIIKGDFVSIDFEGKHDGESIEELKREDYMLEIGSERFFPGFEEQLIGLKKGESKEVTVKIPDDYASEKIAGKDIPFSVTVKGIKEKILPELDKNFVKNLENCESIEELKQDIKKSLEEENKVRIDMELKGQIVDKILERNEFQVPPSLVERQIFSMMIDAKRRMILGGMDPEKAAEVSANLHDKFKDEAEKIVKFSYLINGITEKESIEVYENDVEDKLKDFAGKYAQDYESLKKSYEEGDRIEQFKLKILEEKTLDFIEGQAKVIFVERQEEK